MRSRRWSRGAYVTDYGTVRGFLVSSPRRLARGEWHDAACGSGSGNRGGRRGIRDSDGSGCIIVTWSYSGVFYDLEMIAYDSSKQAAVAMV